MAAIKAYSPLLVRSMASQKPTTPSATKTVGSKQRLGLLSKAEELGVLSAATDTGTPSTLLSLSLVLLVVGPACVFLVPEDYPWQIGLQFVVNLLSVLAGSAAFAASNLVSTLQKSN